MNGREHQHRTINRNLWRLLAAAVSILWLAGIRPATALAGGSSSPQPTGLLVHFAAHGPCAVSAGTLQSDGTTTATVTPSGAGTCTITATQPGNSSYLPAPPVARSFTLAGAPTTTALSPVPSTPYDDQQSFTATVTPASISSQTISGTVTFSVDGTAVASAPVNSSGVATSTPVTLALTPGKHTLAAAFVSTNASFGNSTTTGSLTITQEDTALQYTGATAFAQGRTATLAATLREDGLTPIANRTITLWLGSPTRSCTARTASTGIASCTVPTTSLPLGPEPLGASFAGDTDYAGSADTSQSGAIAGFPASGAYVIGDASAASAINGGSSVTWWGPTWPRDNSLSASATPTQFFGFAATTSTTPPACGGSWTSTTAKSLTPPRNIPSYVAVLVSSQIATSSPGSYSGDVKQIVAVQTDGTHVGTGHIAGILCGGSSHPSTSSLLALQGKLRRHLSPPASPFQIASPRQHRSVPAAAGRHPTRAHSGARAAGPSRHLHPLSRTIRTQTIIFPAIGSHGVGGPPFTISAESVAGSSITVPDDPSTLAPPNNPSIATSIYTSTQFLYTGSNPIQTGLTATINPAHVAVLHGKVLTQDGQNPLPGVTVSVLNHPEFGQTISRLDGQYDLVVNGGGPLTLVYNLTGYLRAWRQVQTPWDDYANVENVALVALDPNDTAIQFGSTAPGQVAEGSVVTDPRGTRQAVLYVPPGETGQIVMPDGSTQSSSGVHLHLTEYTVGGDNLAAMPADLPAASAYTYCFNLTADEELSTGATTVLLGKTAYAYVDNFLGVPAGTVVPNGYYNKLTGQWQSLPNGVVVSVLSISGGEANLDVTGSGQPATSSQYAALGITDDERHQIATLYGAGASFWRAPIPHFSAPFDYNYGYRDPRHPPVRPQVRDWETNPKQPGWGTLDALGQVFGEDIPLTGTPFALHYSSDRVPGFVPTFSLQISPASVDPNLIQIDIEVTVAGRVFDYTEPPTPNQMFTFTWDGKDVYGRPVQGPSTATVRIVYVYPMSYAILNGDATAFGAFADQPVVLAHPVGDTTTIDVIQSVTEQLGSWNAGADGLGGWSLSVHHSYDPAQRVLYLGNGTTRRGQDIINALSTIAGNGNTGSCSVSQCGDGGQATAADLYPGALAAGTDGSFNVIDRARATIRSITPAGAIGTIAGGGAISCATSATCGDGSPATSVALRNPTDIARAPDGSLLIADYGDRRLRKVDASGTITTIAGNGSNNPSATTDGIPATTAPLDPNHVAVGSDGTIYLSDDDHARIRAVGTNGLISTVAGNGSCPTNPLPSDGALATSTDVCDVTGLAVGPDGALYFTNPTGVYRIDVSGVLHLLAGGGSSYADGIPATQANTGSPGPRWIAVDKQNNVDFGMVSVGYGAVVKQITPDGIIRTIAGAPNKPDTFNGDGLPAVGSQLSLGAGGLALALAPDGTLSIADSGHGYIRSVAPELPGIQATDILIPSADGTQVYRFDNTGRHLQTLNALTDTPIYTFGYDSAGRLTSVTDSDGNVTTITRDSSGTPTGITGPYGQITLLGLNGNGFLASVTDPMGNSEHLGYGTGGLLTSITGPLNDTYTFTYDSLGRLTGASDPLGGVTTIAHAPVNTPAAIGQQATTTTALGRTTQYRDLTLAAGAQQLAQTLADGSTLSSTQGLDGSLTATGSSGMQTVMQTAPDPRFGLQVPVTSSLQVTTPSGLVSSTAHTRTVTLGTPGNPLSLSGQVDTLNTGGGAATSTYDASHHTLTITSAGGRQSLLTLDGSGRPLSTQVGSLAPEIAGYDSHGRLSTSTQGTGPSARTVTYAYGSDGGLAGITDALGEHTSFVHDVDGRVIGTGLPGGRTITLGRDAEGNVTSYTTPGGNVSSLTYDARGQLTSYTPPVVGSARTTSYAYNLDGQLTGVKQPDGSSIGYSYAASGLPTTIQLSRGSIGLTYDPATSNLTGITAPGGVALSFAYDGTLPTSESLAGPVTGSYSTTYDSHLRMASDSVDGAYPASYQYDADYMLTRAGDLTLSHDGATGLLTGTSLGAVQTSDIYDQYGSLASETATANGTPLLSDSYLTDAAGRITQRTETIGGTTHVFAYSYDSADRIASVTEDGNPFASYSYDADGNRVNTTDGQGTAAATYDAQDRLTQYGNTTYAYNGEGDLITATGASGTTTYTYDELGTVLGAAMPDGTHITYLLDGRNERVGREVNGTLTQGFLYDGSGHVVAETDGNSNVLSRFVYGESGTPSLMLAGGQEYRIISDTLGSPRLIVNSGNGQVVERLDYDPFGRQTIAYTAPGWNTNLMPFGFSGGLADPATGLIHLGERDYDPVTGRWTTPDPSGFAGGNNLYAYVLDDPVNLVDPSGLGPRLKNALLSGLEIGGGVVSVVAATALLPESGGTSVLIGAEGATAIVGGVQNLWNGNQDAPTGVFGSVGKLGASFAGDQHPALQSALQTVGDAGDLAVGITCNPSSQTLEYANLGEDGNLAYGTENALQGLPQVSQADYQAANTVSNVVTGYGTASDAGPLVQTAVQSTESPVQANSPSLQMQMDQQVNQLMQAQVRGVGGP